MAEDLHVDMEEIAREMRFLEKSIAAHIRRNLRKAVTESGAEVTAAIKAEASWSKRIPGATSLAMSFGAQKVGVSVKVNAKKAPHARPFEFGNSNGYSEERVQARVSSGSARNRRPEFLLHRRAELLVNVLQLLVDEVQAGVNTNPVSH